MKKEGGERRTSRISRALTVLPIRFYQITISPLLPNACRFYPNCSSYAIQAITDHGVWKGLRLTGSRLLRCQPFSKGGLDPVPPRVMR